MAKSSIMIAMCMASLLVAASALEFKGEATGRKLLKDGGKYEDKGHGGHEYEHKEYEHQYKPKEYKPYKPQPYVYKPKVEDRPVVYYHKQPTYTKPHVVVYKKPVYKKYEKEHEKKHGIYGKIVKFFKKYEHKKYEDKKYHH